MVREIWIDELMDGSVYTYIDISTSALVYYPDLIFSGGGRHYFRLAVGELDVRHEGRRAARRAVGARAVRVDDRARDGAGARVLRRVDGRLPPGANTRTHTRAAGAYPGIICMHVRARLRACVRVCACVCVRALCICGSCPQRRPE